jgi:hypothetical protein
MNEDFYKEAEEGNYIHRIKTMGWGAWLLILLLILFILWIFFGRQSYEYKSHYHPKYDNNSYVSYDDNNSYDNNSYDNNNDSVCDILDVETDTGNDSVCKIERDKEDDQADSRFSQNDIEKALGEHKCFKNGKISKCEMVCKEAIEEIYNKPFLCVRPNFLKNPETKRNLELDLYNDELKIAVEMNGIQHYKWPNYTGMTKKQFINQIRRDRFKVEACDANGVYLITVPYTVPPDKVKKYIWNHLPENYKDNNSDNGVCQIT